MSKDYYHILGVEKTASQDEIKKAYKKLAKQFHPDINKDPAESERFKEINEAAAVLGDAEKREQYDKFGSAGPQMGGFDFSGGGFPFEDILSEVFGGLGGAFGFGGRHGPSRGHDLAADVEVTLEEVAKGAKRVIATNKLAPCRSCNGKGGTGVKTCQDCQGSGMVRRAQRTPFGVFASTTTCKVCGGQGESVEHPCETCDGSGRLRERKEIEVKIPAGVEDGMRLRVAGEGEAGERGAGAGDLYVTVSVGKHKYFERDGDDLYLEAPVSFVTACVGGEVEVPTLDGKASVKIPAGTQPGTIFKLAGKGLPDVRGRWVGNELVRVTIDVPKKVSKKQTELLKEFEKESGKKGWFG